MRSHDKWQCLLLGIECLWWSWEWIDGRQLHAGSGNGSLVQSYIETNLKLITPNNGDFLNEKDGMVCANSVFFDCVMKHKSRLTHNQYGFMRI